MRKTFFLFIFFLSMPPCVLAKEGDDSSDHSLTIRHSGQFIKNNTYSPYRVGFRRMCEGMELDGRYQYFFALIEAHVLPDATCDACRVFFKTFASACKSLKKNKRKKTSKSKKNKVEDVSDESNDDVPKIINGYPVPNILVANAALETFGKMASSSISEMSLVAIKKLTHFMRSGPHSSDSEREYADMVATYCEDPFREMIEIKEAEEYSHESGNSNDDGSNSVSPDELFNF